MRKARKAMAIILSIILCAGLCTATVRADEIHPNFYENEAYGDESASEGEIISEESVSEEEVSEEEIASEDVSEEKTKEEDDSQKDDKKENEEQDSEENESEELIDDLADPNQDSIEINETNFPDEAFRSYVSTYVDKDHNTRLSKEERDDVTTVFVNNQQVASLKGIEFFSNLKELYCDNNQITELDLSNNPELELLQCKNNKLTNLNMNGCTKLYWLNCTQNELTALDTGSNIALTKIQCGENQLTGLDLTKNRALISLSCYVNPIEELDLSKNAALDDIQCQMTKLYSLDVSNNTELTSLCCFTAMLSSLNVSNNTKLKHLYVSENKLNSIDVSNNEELETLSITKNNISELDLSKNPLLRFFAGAGNPVKEIDITNNPLLIYAYQEGQRATEDPGISYYILEEGTGYPLNSFVFDKGDHILFDGVEGRVIDLFSDVPDDAWYVPYIQYVYSNNIMSGKGENFAPNDSLKREEFTQMLYSHSGKPPVTIENPFSDVKDSWYKDSVLWAKENGIADGKLKNGKLVFGVGQNITREELALMIYKYAKLKNYDLERTEGATEGFSDSNKVSSWSKEALEWAITQGIIGGKGKSGAPKSELKIDPQGKASRAECACMIANLLQKNAKE